MKVKEILKREKNVIVNSEKPFVLIQHNYETQFGEGVTEAEREDILEKEVKQTYLIKGVCENCLRVTI